MSTFNTRQLRELDDFAELDEFDPYNRRYHELGEEPEADQDSYRDQDDDDDLQ